MDLKGDRENHETLVLEQKTVICLTSKDGDTFHVAYSIAKLSTVLRELVQENTDEYNLCSRKPLDTDDSSDREMITMDTPTISSATLEKVIEFCNRYSLEPMKEIQGPFESENIGDIVQDSYAKFIQNLEWRLLLQLVGAANFLDIKPLLQLSCLGVVRRTLGRSADEIRPMFGTRNPVNGQWDKEQSAIVQQENLWAASAREKFFAKYKSHDGQKIDPTG